MRIKKIHELDKNLQGLIDDYVAKGHSIHEAILLMCNEEKKDGFDIDSHGFSIEDDIIPLLSEEIKIKLKEEYLKIPRYNERYSKKEIDQKELLEQKLNNIQGENV